VGINEIDTLKIQKKQTESLGVSCRGFLLGLSQKGNKILIKSKNKKLGFDTFKKHLKIFLYCWIL
jgi:hypothetical protein